MRILGSAPRVAVALLLGARPGLSAQVILNVHDLYARAAARVPPAGIVEVGTLDNYSGFATVGGFDLAHRLGRPLAGSESAVSLPHCPNARPRQEPVGYRLVVGPLQTEIGRAVLVLARACRIERDGRAQARVRETIALFRPDEHDRWQLRSVDQRGERDASPPVIATRSIIGDSWSMAFLFLAAAGLVGIVVARRRMGHERWLATMLPQPVEAEMRRRAWREDGVGALPFVGGWAVALVIGCAWIFLAAFSDPDAWQPSMALRTVFEVSGGACLLSSLHTALMRPMPYRGPLVCAALGACVGWLAGVISRSVPGMTMTSAVVGGALYGALVGVAALRRAAPGT